MTKDSVLIGLKAPYVDEFDGYNGFITVIRYPMRYNNFLWINTD